MRILTLNKREHVNIDILSRHFSLVEDLQVLSWNPQIKSAFDAFDEYKPDILLFHSSLNHIVEKVRIAFPKTKFVCEDNTGNESYDYDVTFTTMCNKRFPKKSYIYIGYDLASLINKTDKQIYATDICFNGNLNNQKNMNQFQELVNPLSCIRKNNRLKFYGIGHGGEYACGVLSDLDQFSAYSQAKVSIILKNWFDNENYESPFALLNSLKVNANTIHNIPEAITSGFFVDNKKDLLQTLQKLLESSKRESGSDLVTAFSSCSSIFQQLSLDDSKINESSSQLIERYKL